MTRFYFFLTVDLPPGHQDPVTYLDALYEAGCDDSIVGIGDSSLRIHFVREGDDLSAVVANAEVGCFREGDDLSAVVANAEASVRRAIPDAHVAWRWDREAEEYEPDNAPPVEPQSDDPDSDPIDEIVKSGIRDINEDQHAIVDSTEARKKFMGCVLRGINRQALWGAMKSWLAALGINFRGQ